MNSRIEIVCSNPACDATGNIELSMKLNTLNVGGTITVSHPCPLCGGSLGAAGGFYERDEDGVLIRKGDFRP